MDPQEKFLLVVGGPTASGKTALAIRLARHFDCPILSADSRQFYRELSIGTAKPGPEERQRAPHHFIDNRSIFEPYSVGEFEREALAFLRSIYEEQDLAVAVGGSGLYLKALCEGMDAFPEVGLARRRSVERDLREKGLESLQEELRRTDPAYFELVDLQNPSRLVRALSVIRETGRPFSAFHREKPANRFFRPIYLQVHWPRALLYERIDRRVLDMLAQGLEEEARALFPQADLPALQTVGYRELFAHFRGEYEREEAIRLIQRNTRRFAKRQLSWFRRDGHWKHFRPSEWMELLAYLDQARTNGWHLRTTGEEADAAQRVELLDRQERVLGHFTWLAVEKENLLYWPDGMEKEEAPAALLRHESLLRAEESDACILIRPEAELLLRRLGCIPVPGKAIPSRVQKTIEARWPGHSLQTWRKDTATK